MILFRLERVQSGSMRRKFMAWPRGNPRGKRNTRLKVTGQEEMKSLIVWETRLARNGSGELGFYSVGYDKATGEQIAYAQSPLLDTPCTPQHEKHFISRLRKACEEPILELNALLKRRRVRIAGQYQSSLPSQSATAGEEVQRLINLWRGDFTPGGPFGVPCPFVYSGGLKCDGYIIRVDGHKKMGTSWIQDAKGKWQAEEGCGDLISYRLFCSVKGGSRQPRIQPRAPMEARHSSGETEGRRDCRLEIFSRARVIRTTNPIQRRRMCR